MRSEEQDNIESSSHIDIAAFNRSFKVAIRELGFRSIQHIRARGVRQSVCTSEPFELLGELHFIGHCDDQCR